MERPDVDRIEGLQPTIAIDQKRAAPNPRSEVARSYGLHGWRFFLVELLIVLAIAALALGEAPPDWIVGIGAGAGAAVVAVVVEAGIGLGRSSLRSPRAVVYAVLGFAAVVAAGPLVVIVLIGSGLGRNLGEQFLRFVRLLVQTNAREKRQRSSLSGSTSAPRTCRSPSDTATSPTSPRRSRCSSGPTFRSGPSSSST